MTREIKFRAWNKVTNNMVDLLSMTPFALDANFNMHGLFIPFHDNYILMQYTGLKDKNGVEIYEGDILVQFRGKDHEVGNYEVYWEEDRSSFRGRIGESFEMSLDLRRVGLEVIGNIHENPEFLD